MAKYDGKTAITFGVFDLLHYGHFELFRRIRELVGDDGMVVVAVQSDAFVSKYKPQAKLVYDWNTRRQMIEALRYVDKVVPYTDVDASIKDYEFDVAVFGPDQIHAGFMNARKWCGDNGRVVVVLQRTDGISSSQLRNGR